ncbi:MAG: hypothetical protein ACQESR_25690 [Planctomycetota bacterium]
MENPPRRPAGRAQEPKLYRLSDATARPLLTVALRPMEDKRRDLSEIRLLAENQIQYRILAMEGVKDFAADELFHDMTEIVVVDPADEAEQSFLEELRIDPSTETALSVLLAPPGEAGRDSRGRHEQGPVVRRASEGRVLLRSRWT